MQKQETDTMAEARAPIREEHILVESLGSQAPLFLALPHGEGPFPAILLCHEVTGLTEHIRSLTRRLAREGFVAGAINLFSRDRSVSGRGYQRQLELLHITPEAEMVDDSCAAIEYLKGMPQVQPASVAIWGFSMGARIASLVAAGRVPDLAACVAYYATIYRPPGSRDLFSWLLDTAPNITPPLYCIYGDADEVSPSDKVEELRKLLDERTAPSEVIVYPGARHAFFSSESRNYDATYAADAWQRTLVFLRRYCKI